MSDERTDPDDRQRTSDDRRRTPDDGRRGPTGQGSDPIRKAGTLAYQSLIAALVLGLLIVVTVALGFLVYRDALDPGSFLLLVGILVGFSLGRLDAVL